MFCFLHSGIFHLQGPQHWQPDKHCDCKVSHNKQRAGKTAKLVLISLLTHLQTSMWYTYFINEIIPFDYFSLYVSQDGPVISFNAQTTLKNFCIWQQSQNILDDNHHSHHDTAILITRCKKNIICCALCML